MDTSNRIDFFAYDSVDCSLVAGYVVSFFQRDYAVFRIISTSPLKQYMVSFLSLW